MDKKLDYIDAAKGILILLVFFLHVGWYYVDMLHGNNNVFVALHQFAKYTYRPFFMASFFVIHGYCSKKKRTIGETFTYGSQTLLIPLIFLCLYKNHWFCITMFLAIMVKSALDKIDNKKIEMCVSLLLAYVAVILKTCLMKDAYCIDYALVFLLFIYIGSECKLLFRNDKIGFVGGGICAALTFFYVYFDTLPPQITGNSFCVSVMDFPIFCIYSVCGTSFVFALARKMQHLSFLQSIGRNSLIYYLTHFYGLVIVYRFGRRWLDSTDNLYVSLGLYLAFIVALVIMCSIISALILRYCPWLIGRKHVAP